MTPFISVTGPAVPVLLDNVDTDTIIRIERLSTIARKDLGEYAFESLRVSRAGTTTNSPLNLDNFDRAPILLAGANFGCGSSREGAVWAIQSLGIRCVIASSFGDIFFNNCFKNGILPVLLARERIDFLAKNTSAGQSLTVDLVNCTISLAADASPIPFEVNPLQRDMLIAGLDEIEATLSCDSLISAWQQRDQVERPWIWQTN